ncbi:Rap guanine nucleotide exchange factor 4 [Bulinus truncatus]|nr:Rap guanine nucleotide exchange factor 4 [Bulinus truncatus]
MQLSREAELDLPLFTPTQGAADYTLGHHSHNKDEKAIFPTGATTIIIAEAAKAWQYGGSFKRLKHPHPHVQDQTKHRHEVPVTPVPEQDGPTASTMHILEVMSTKELASQITYYDWELFMSVSEQEILNKIFGPTVFPDGIFPNLQQFLRRFEQLQYWVVTEMVLLTNLGKRVQLLRKFIKLAQHCKELKNFHGFAAITQGLGHIAVSRLSQTWEKLPSKAKKMFSEFEAFMEPARNNRNYRIAVSKLTSPIIPFMSLLIQDMTFTNEGNKTCYDNLVNFEKMHMIAQTLRTVRFCKQSHVEPESSETIKATTEIRSYVRNLQVIDNHRILTNLSHKCEPRKG